MKKLIPGFLIALMLAASPSFAQGSLSNQVLRLLTRDNTWSGINIFSHTKGATLERGTAPSLTTDTLYNVGGGLFWNGSAVSTSASNGTVTSVALTVPAILSVAGSPITTAGTLAVTLATETANRIFAGPTSGGAATPTFRALVAADIPDISATYLTPSSTAALTNKTGNISQWTNDAGYLTSVGSITSLGTVTAGTWNATVIAGQYGGTGAANTGKTITLGGNISTAAALSTVGANALTLTTTAATNVTLPTTGTLATTAATSFSSLAAVGTIGTGVWQGTAVAGGFGGTGQSTYAVGDILYASASTTLSKLADVATGNVLLSGGVTTAPSWGKVAMASAVSGTLPLANGGTGLSAVVDDSLIVSNGTIFQVKTLTSGILSYDTASNTFSVPTSFILGSGAPTPSATNILLQSTVSAMLNVSIGTGGSAADIGVNRIAAGNGADTAFGNGEYVNILNTYSSTDLSFAQVREILSLNPSANQTGTIRGTYVSLNSTGSKTYVTTEALYVLGAPGTSGTQTTNVGVRGEAEQNGAGTITTNIGIKALAGTSAAGTITNNRGISIETPASGGGGVITNNYGMYINDQTPGVGVPTINYAFYYAAPSSKEVIIKSDGQVLIKALKTTGSAGSKAVVCVDVTTGQLFSSSTSTDCSN